MSYELVPGAPASLTHRMNCGAPGLLGFLFIYLFALAYFNLVIKLQSATHPQPELSSEGTDFSQVMIPINFEDGRHQSKLEVGEMRGCGDPSHLNELWRSSPCPSSSPTFLK